MKIINTESDVRIWLDDRYAMHKFKNLTLWWLEYYRFGKDYMPDEIYADAEFEKVYQKYEEMK